jgi:hypothetical protein
VIAGALLGPDGQVKRSITFPRSPVSINAIRGSFGPAVATDGDGFLVAYESYAETAPSTPGLPQIVVQAFDKDGNALQGSYQAALSAQASDLQYSSIALAATLDRLCLPRGLAGSPRRAGAHRRCRAQRRGHVGAAANLRQRADQRRRQLRPQRRLRPAHRPRADRLPLRRAARDRDPPEWRDRDRQPAGAVAGAIPGWRARRRWRGTPATAAGSSPTRIDTASQRHVFVPVNSDGLQAFPAASGFFIAANDNSLACPAPQSVPVVDLRFEELPGATTFADASGRGNPGLCTGATCPTAGFAGAPGAPLSDYAAQFDGVDDGLTLTRTIQDDFSVAFWIKTPPGTGQKTIVDGGSIASNGFAIRLNSGGVTVYAPGISFQTIQRVDDDQWHFVVVSRNFASGQVDIYLDGALARGLPGTPGVSLTNAATLRIGVKPDGTLPLRATLDNLQIIPAALAADAVLAMYNRTLQSYCVAAGTSGSNVYWAKVAASQPDVRGGRVTATQRA